MQRFPGHEREVIRRCVDKGSALLLFDFDGTLAPIVSRPSGARLPARWRSRLGKLARNRRIAVGIVTGRPYRDIRKRVPCRGIILSTDHGHEVRRGARLLKRVGGDIKGEISRLARESQRILDIEPRALVERKDYSVAIHYRLVPKQRKAYVIREFRRLAKPYCKRLGLAISRGKEVLEARQAGLWDKGKASLWIWRNLAPRALPFYFGDDTTDEDAFRALARSGITVRMGKKRSSRARYFIDSMDEAAPFLDRLHRRLNRIK